MKTISKDFLEMSVNVSAGCPQKILLMSQVADFQLCYLSNIAIVIPVFPVNPVFDIYWKYGVYGIYGV